MGDLQNGQYGYGGHGNTNTSRVNRDGTLLVGSQRQTSVVVQGTAVGEAGWQGGMADSTILLPVVW